MASAEPLPGYRKALARTAALVVAALAFALFLLLYLGDAGAKKATEFLACYLLELSLSVDNLFVFLLLMERFGANGRARERVLGWGVIGAMVLRAGFVLGGAKLLVRFHSLFYLLGGLLLVAALRLLFEHGEHLHEAPKTNLLVRLLGKVVPQASAEAAAREPAALWVRERGRLRATPLLALLIAIESADVIFAVDSVPAAFAVTTDGAIVFAANVFALLGLRSLFFVVGAALGQLRYLRVALALILAMVGLKMLLIGIVEIPAWATLLAIVTVLGGAIGLSRLRAT